MTRTTAHQGDRAVAAEQESHRISAWDVTVKALHGLASLKLTVTLFALSIFLVFAGTLVQVDKGIWTVVDEYFRTAFAFIELHIFMPDAWVQQIGLSEDWGFFFPGGWLIGVLLLINILAAHAIRFTVKARGQRLTLGLIVTVVGVVITALVIAGVFQQEIAATEDAAFWRVLLRLIKGGVAALILMAGCMLLFKKRAGIVLLHAGIILMLFSELFTGLYAVEGQMRIREGQTVNYVYHTTAFELAVIDTSQPKWNQVTAVPEKMVRESAERGQVISDERLPFDIQVTRFMPNSSVGRISEAPNVSNPATAGNGTQLVAVERPEVSGTDPNQSVDIASAYAKLIDKKSGEPIGTYLLSGWLSFQDIPDRVTVDGKTYELYLRFARTYKPYSIHLVDFEHKKYMGTDKPKDFSAHVRVIDESQNIDRQVRIWMNNPLRFAGETFYQSSFDPQDPKVTVLQVVKNAGWMVPYVACMIVATGLTAHFGMYLVSFLKKRGRG